MDCFYCRIQNTDDRKYCGACGSPLNFNEIVEKVVSSQVEAALGQRFRDANLARTELVAQAADKLSGWVRLFAFYVGIPVTAVLLLLGFLGLTTYRGFKDTVDNAVAEFKKTVADRKTQVDDLTGKTHDLDARVANLSVKLPYYESLGSRMEQLSQATDARLTHLGSQQEELKKQVEVLARDTSLNDLQPRVAALARTLVATAHAKGIEVAIVETCRTQSLQQAMFNQGTTKLRAVGMHGFGLAFDVVKIVNGEPQWPKNSDLEKVGDDYSDLGKIGENLGLTWGGDWGTPGVAHPFKDPIHFQSVTPAEQAHVFESAPRCTVGAEGKAKSSSSQ